MSAPGETFEWMDRDGHVWRVPEGWTPSNSGPCRGCRQLVAWCVTLAGRKSPINADGSSHFATCPKADRFRKRKDPPPEPPPFEGIETL